MQTLGFGVVRTGPLRCGGGEAKKTGFFDVLQPRTEITPPSLFLRPAFSCVENLTPG